MTNDHIKSEISAYLAGGLTEARNRQIEAHTASCEKCRQALAKARGKQARQKREALKKASSDPLPNLFLARQGKETGVDQPTSPTPWVLAGLVLITSVIYLFVRHYATGPHPSAIATSSMPVVAVSSAVVPSSAPLSEVNASQSKDASTDSESSKYPVTLQVQQEWKGEDCGIKNPHLVVVRNEDAWEKLWTEMQEKAPRPTVNFSRYVVVGVFAGESPGGATITLGRISEMEEDVSVPYHVSNPKDLGPGASVLTHPYLLSLLPRTTKKIRLTEREALP